MCCWSGVLAEEPEVRELGEGSAVCFLRLRCLWRKPAVVEGEREPLYVNVLLLGVSAANIARYLYDGRRVVVDGSLQSAHWDGPGAREQESVCVLAQRVEFLGPAPQWVLGPGGEQYRCGDFIPLETSSVVGFSDEMWS